MLFAVVGWFLSAGEHSEWDAASHVMDRILACVMLNAAAFEAWMLDVGVIRAVHLWAAHAAIAGAANGLLVFAHIASGRHPHQHAAYRWAPAVSYLLLATLGGLLPLQAVSAH